MWINRYNQWLSTVIGHYGSLEGFPYVRTVRIMLRQARTELAELDKFFIMVRGRIPDDDPSVIAQREYQKATLEVEKSLLKWLDNRELEP